MMIKGISDKHTIGWLRRQKVNAVTKLNPQDKSDIICRIISGVPVPLIVMEDCGNNFNLLAGEDTVAVVKQFISGNFNLLNSDLMKLLGLNEFEGKTFFEFNDDEKHVFLEREVMVNILRPLAEPFRQIIKDSLNTMQVQVQQEVDVITCEADELLEKYLGHKYFEAVCIPSLSIDLVTQFLMITEEGVSTELRVKDIIAFKETLKKDEYSKWDISKELDYLAKAFPEKTNYLKKTHVPMVFVVGKKALKDKVKPQQFRRIMDEFFDNMPENYKKACDSSSSKSKTNARIRAIVDYYVKSAK